MDVLDEREIRRDESGERKREIAENQRTTQLENQRTTQLDFFRPAKECLPDVEHVKPSVAGE